MLCNFHGPSRYPHSIPLVRYNAQCYLMPDAITHNGVFLCALQLISFLPSLPGLLPYWWVCQLGSHHLAGRSGGGRKCASDCGLDDRAGHWDGAQHPGVIVLVQSPGTHRLVNARRGAVSHQPQRRDACRNHRHFYLCQRAHFTVWRDRPICPPDEAHPAFPCRRDAGRRAAVWPAGVQQSRRAFSCAGACLRPG